MLNIRNVRAGYGEIQVLKDVTIDVVDGQTTALLGANGAGKTTLIRCVFRMIPVVTGKIDFYNQDLSQRPIHELVQLGLSLVPEGRGILNTLTCRENLKLGSLGNKHKYKERIQFIMEIFPDLVAKLDQLAGSLSGGQQQMLAIGRALMSYPKLLVLDEPSLGLSPLLVETVYRALEMIQRTEKVTILLVEQNTHYALKLASKVYFLENGAITQSGDALEFRDQTRILQSYFGSK